MIIVARQGYRPKEGQHLLGPLGVALFARSAGILGHRQRRVVEQLRQHLAEIAENRLAQAQFHRLEIAHALLLPLRLD
jgi:hypothetical protein